MLSEEEKVIQFYKRFIEAEEQELEWMYREDEEYYRDSIEQKELLIKGWRNILNLITKLQKENKEKDKQIDELIKYIDNNNYVDSEECQFQYDFKIKECIGKGDCKDCIKQYFEKQAKEKGE